MAIIKNILGKVKSKKTEEKHESQKTPDKMYFSKSLKSNIEMIRSLFGRAADLVIREFTIQPGIEAAIVLIKGLAEIKLINAQVIGPLMLNDKFCDIKSSDEILNVLKESIIPDVYINEESDVEKAIDELLIGNSILLLNGLEKVLAIGTQGWKERSVSEPVTENVVRGPRDGFTESIENNTALIRRRIKSPSLRFESIKIGSETKTTIMIAYLEGIAKKRIINEVRNRLNSIEIDGILESGYIEELIEDNPISPFPQIEHSERPDKISAAILEGHVIILVDTTPFALIVPTIFFQFLQSADDYYERSSVGSLTRFVRIAAYFISVVLPALYIALTSYHQEMIPTPLALSIAASREGVPLPSIGEAFIMEGTFEILREAGLRLPKQTGQAVSIVGGLVIGQAAVQAGIVSQAMVIVVALTGISSFAIPAFNASASGRLLRFPLMLMASVLGLPGILAGLSIIIIHMNSLRSFGVSYMEPFISARENEFKDIAVRSQWWKMNRLSRYFARRKMSREDPNLKPGPGASSGKRNGNG